jgi:preprotein translocase subunit SecA
MGILKRAKESETKRFLKRANKKAREIESLSLKMSQLSDDILTNKTVELKERLAQGETLDDVLVEAFAVCREASQRILGMKHYPVQLVGGMALHEGSIAEMRTGEGKTLVATLPAYLNALSGKGVHVVTVNDYLAERDHELMAPLYRFLGLTTGVITGNMQPHERREQYQADITYITNTELGFDFLRDNMVLSKDEKVQRDLPYCIVDEVDSVLLDDARTPLIISGGGEEPSNLYKVVDMFVRTLRFEKDFKKDEESKQVWLLDAGIDKVERFFRMKNFTNSDAMTIRFHIEKSLYCHQFMELDRDYIVRNGEVLIIDQGTGRVSDGRRFSNGLHQCLEAKAGVEIKKESKTLATITYQNFFLLYDKISGMTGTAKTEELEFLEIYDLDVYQIPTNCPSQRVDLEDKLYLSANAKFNAIVEDIEACVATGQPVLIGTSSIEKSEYLSEKLNQKNIQHVVLNAKNHAREADIIADAGQKGAVTIATNMAGRGTDIKLGDGVRELGGLKIIGTERSENRRIDNQLRGRSGRQGDHGMSQFYLSFDDDLLRIFSPPAIKARLAKLVQDESAPIENRFLMKSIQSSQQKLEGTHYDQRKETIKYDSINNEQRVKLYEQRNQLLEEDVSILPILKEATKEWVLTVLADNFEGYRIQRNRDSFEQSATLFHQNLTSNGISIDFNELMKLEGQKIKQVSEWVVEQLTDLLNKRETALEGSEDMLRVQVLQAVDTAWTDHLEVLTGLKEEVRFASYKQAKPEQEYLNMSLTEFNKMTEHITSYLAQLFIQTNQSSEDVEVA